MFMSFYLSCRKTLYAFLLERHRNKSKQKMVSNKTPFCAYQSTKENKSTIVFIFPIQIYVIVMMVENIDNVCILTLQSVI